MSKADQVCSASLSMPRVRKEMIEFLIELKSDDPRPRWKDERRQGLASGIDQVFHFFFDDHDFGSPDVSIVFLNQNEVAAVESVKHALAVILDDVGDAGDDAFLAHPLWPQVTRAAAIAHNCMAAS